MKPTDHIEQQLKHTRVQLNPETDEAVLNDLCTRLHGAKGGASTFRSSIPHKLTKLAVAAVLVVAALWGITHVGGSVDGANVAWADVVRHITQVDYVHFYDIETKPEGYSKISEGWYAHRQFRTRRYGAEQILDNGQTLTVLDINDVVLKKVDSMLAKHGTIHEALMWGLVSLDYADYETKKPISIGPDFLVYEFGPPEDKADWIEKLTVTVGRHSLMPIQIKTYFKKDKQYYSNRLLVFDYEAAKMPEASFTLQDE
jgi:hypothetical protein